MDWLFLSCFAPLTPRRKVISADLSVSVVLPSEARLPRQSGRVALPSTSRPISDGLSVTNGQSVFVPRSDSATHPTTKASNPRTSLWESIPTPGISYWRIIASVYGPKLIRQLLFYRAEARLGMESGRRIPIQRPMAWISCPS